MMLPRLRRAVCEANLELVRRGLVIHTFGNVSGIDRERGLVAIKPSGVDYADLRPGTMVLVDLEGRVVEGDLRPSSDTPTHLALYRAWSELGGVAHTHSTFATGWAQSCRELPCLGTTHADYAHGSVPCAAPMRDELVAGDYEANTGRQIIEALAGRDRAAVPMVLVGGHGPFAWGADAAAAAHHAWILELLAHLALIARQVNPDIGPLPQAIQDRHYRRKHGPQAYYGQRS